MQGEDDTRLFAPAGEGLILGSSPRMTIGVMGDEATGQ